MSLERARILKATGNAKKSAPAQANANDANVATWAKPEARRVPAVVANAEERARSLLTDAQAKASAIVDEAKRAVVDIERQAAEEARADEIARLTAELLVLRDTEEKKAARELDRTIAVARVLAERLIGETLAADPDRVMAMATRALEETRGARRVRIECSSADVPALQRMLAALGDGVATVEADATLERGSLIVHTELGRIDARLAPQLERLAEALREVLREQGASDS